MMEEFFCQMSVDLVLYLLFCVCDGCCYLSGQCCVSFLSLQRLLKWKIIWTHMV